MGLQSTIQSVVGTAFLAIGDLAEPVDYIHEGQEPDYDTTTGLVTSDVETVTLRIDEAVLVPFSKKVAEQSPADLVEVSLPGDWLALIPGNSLSIEPTTGDKIVRLDETWVVKGFARDPAKALWKILIRRVGGGADGELIIHE